MKYVVKVILSANKSNIRIIKGKIKNWFYTWQNNLITAYSFFYKKPDDKFNIVFNSLRSTKGLNLGLLIDALTILSNIGVNTDITIAISDDYQLFKLSKNFDASSIEDITKNTNLLLAVENGQGDGEWPIRKNDKIQTTLDDEELKISDNIMIFLSSKSKFSNTELKLLNYWRRGVDLENLTFFDESYLAFYKIIEYFGQKSNILNSQIPKIYMTKTQKKAYKMTNGSGLKDINKKNIDLLCDLISIRNNWDIAHTKVSSLPKDRDNGLYFSYYDDMWDLHHHLKELTRLFIFSHMGLKDFQLVVDGGLYKLSFKKKIT